MRKILPTLGALSLIATAVACRPSAPAPTEWTITPQRVESPAGANSSEPQMSTSSKGVLLSWIELVGTTTTLSRTLSI